MSNRNRAILALPAGLAVIVAGCAQLGQKENMLAAAGFDVRPANTPQRIASLKRLPAHELIQTERDGKPVWIYADPTQCDCLYVGDQSAYQKYSNLKVKANIAETRLEAAQLNTMGWGWGTWGYPGMIGLPVY